MDPHADDDEIAQDPRSGTIVPPICFHPERRTLTAALVAASALVIGAATVLLARWFLP